MAGGVMGQVSGLIPGMNTEEQQYAEQGYEEQGYEEEQYAQ